MGFGQIRSPHFLLTCFASLLLSFCFSSSFLSLLCLFLGTLSTGLIRGKCPLYELNTNLVRTGLDDELIVLDLNDLTADTAITMVQISGHEEAATL